MAEPLKHQPFLALNANLNKVTPIRNGVVRRLPKDSPISSKRLAEIMAKLPDRTHVDGSETTMVSQPRQPPLPQEQPTEREPEPVATKKVKRTGEKSAFIRANPGVPASELVEKAKKQGITLTTQHVYTTRSSAKKKVGKKKRASKKRATGAAPVIAPRKQKASNGASISDLLQAIVDATLEIQRRLSQLTL